MRTHYFLSGLLKPEEFFNLIEIEGASLRRKLCRKVWTGCHGSTPTA